MRSKRLFASYSRSDKAAVIPLCQLLRAGGTRVFRDEDDIKPGDQWQVVLTRRLEDADGIFVFWSQKSAGSTWVKQEYSTAIAMKKEVVPVLLDSTPLDAELARFMWIDLRSCVSFLPWVDYDRNHPLRENIASWLRTLLPVVIVTTCLATILSLVLFNLWWLPVSIFLLGFLLAIVSILIRAKLLRQQDVPSVFRRLSVSEGGPTPEMERDRFVAGVKDLFARRLFNESSG